MKISLFDTHADTPYEIYKRKEGIITNPLHVSLDKASAFDSYCQCMAIWSNRSLSDEDAYGNFDRICDYFDNTVRNCDSAELCKSYGEIEKAIRNGKRAFILTVEDARLLSGDLSRLKHLHERGVRIITFQWQGETCIGGGFDTEAPLTAFGKLTAIECAKMGVIPDISHANEKTSRDIIDVMAKLDKPVIATHSNSYAVCPHKRNMSDALFDTLVSVGGIVGISLAPQHLHTSSKATSEDVFRHIDHYAERRGIQSVCLGCDFDGIETTPSDIQELSEVRAIAECMEKHGYSEMDINAVFWLNAKEFFSKNLI